VEERALSPIFLSAPFILDLNRALAISMVDDVVSSTLILDVAIVYARRLLICVSMLDVDVSILMVKALARRVFDMLLSRKNKV
jgi:hypothetical protein